MDINNIELQIKQIRSQFKTKQIKGVICRSHIENYHQLAIADDVCAYLTWKYGLFLRIKNSYDFGYTIADHWFRQGYYIFVIDGDLIIKTKWVKCRKYIGMMIDKYCMFDVITFYPRSEKFRYYITQKKYWKIHKWHVYNGDDADYLGAHFRVSESEFTHLLWGN